MDNKCWAFGDTEDCAWVYFGYGSRWDMIGPNYKKGLLLSFRAIKIFLYYDYPLHQSRCIDEEDIKKLGIDFLPDTFSHNEIEDKDYYDFSGRYWEALTTKQKMWMSAISIDHPNAEEWFEELEKYSGGFLRDNPDYKEEMKNVVTVDGEKYYTNIPSREAIKEIDPPSGIALENVWRNDKEAMEEDGNYSTWWGDFTKEELEAMDKANEEAWQEFIDEE